MLTVRERFPLVWWVLFLLWEGVLEFVEGSFDVARHGDVDYAVKVVPFEGQTKVFGPCHVNSNSVQVLYCVENVI